MQVKFTCLTHQFIQTHTKSQRFVAMASGYVFVYIISTSVLLVSEIA